MVHANLGHALAESGELEAALDSYDQAVRLKSGHASAWSNRAMVLARLGRIDEALASHERATRLAPSDAGILMQYGLGLMQAGRLDEASAALEAAVRVDPGNAGAHVNLGYIRLERMEFEAGWPEVDWRWRGPLKPPPSQLRSRPYWRGAPDGGPLLVWSEQGIGDQVLYGAMLRDLDRMPRAKIVTLDPRLIPAFRREFTRIRFVPERMRVPESAYAEQIPIGGLGRFLRRRREDFMRFPPPYLRADPERVRRLRQEPVFSRSPVCGLSWSSVNRRIGREKSLPLEALSEILGLPGLGFVNLQYGDVASELQAVRSRLGVSVESVAGVDPFDDIDGLLALIEACDVVVTTSNSTAHLAGALGKETLQLLPHASGRLWYWHEVDGRSLWYPSVRIFRQAVQDRWHEPVMAVAEYLRKNHARR